MKILKYILSSWLMYLYLAGTNSLAAESLLIKADLVPQYTTSYFTVRPDTRKCVAPICGGWIVSEVNQKKMKCADGSIKSECYVGTELIKIPGLLPEQVDLLHQAMNESSALLEGGVSNFVNYGLLVIDNAWIAASNLKPEGEFVNVSNNGLVCITSPCLSYDADVLNKKFIRSLASFDLSSSGASATQIKLGREVVARGDALPMAGSYVEVFGTAGTALGFKAAQFYLPLKGEAPKLCMPTGCSGQICADSPVVSTCEWKPEYECYKTAMCTTQSTGDCGWVMDDALRKCLDSAAGNILLK